MATEYVLTQVASEVQTAINNALNPDTTLTVSGKPADSKAVGDAISQLSEEMANMGGGVEPAEDDVPKVFFGGALQQTKDEAVVPFSYRSKTLSFDCYAEIKAQGNSTLQWPKKNQTVKLFKDAECAEKLKIDFKGWGKQNKFVIKANWRDLTHVRDIVSVRLEGDCLKTNPNYNEFPDLLKTSPNLGGVDGFPVVVYADGVYQGRYMWNIPKDKWMTNMDDELDTHCILCSENFKSGCFRASAKIDGSDWTDEIHDTVPDSIKARWNEVINFVMNSTDEEFVANLDSHIKVSTLIDRHLMGLLSCDFDGYGKNQLYITYDGQQWYADRYDKDGTWGNYWTGNSMLPSDYGRDQYEDFTSADSDGSGNLLFIRLEQLFYDRLQSRWAELSVGALSIPNVINRFRELYDVTPPHLIEEDYASTTANGAFTGIPNKTTCTIQQIQTFAVERHAWVDEYIAGLTPGISVPCEGITLSASSLTFAEAGTQTLTAIVTPDGCTDSVTWTSDNPSVAAVSGGVVTAITNGSASITATCGAYSASCSVVVNMPAQGVAGASGILEGINMYSGYLSSEDGTPMESSTDVYSDPVPINFELSDETTRTMTVVYTSGNNSYCRIVFYDENDSFVSSVSGPVTRHDVPAEATSFRVSLYGSGSSVEVAIEKYTNSFKVSTLDGAYNTTNGAFNADDTGSCHTKTTVNTTDGWVVNNAWGVFFFDADDNYISKISPRYDGIATEVTVPENTASIAACTEDSKATTAFLAQYISVGDGQLSTT